MRVLITGASGFVGSYLVPELISGGHHVVGLTRSDVGAEALRAAGAEVERGDVNDLPRLRTMAARCEGVIHTAFNHDFSRMKENSEADRRVIEALGEGLSRSDQPFIVTSGTGLVWSASGGPVVETDEPAPSTEVPRAMTEEAARMLSERGMRVMLMRLPQVHDTAHNGRIALHIQLARRHGCVAYVGDGANRVPAAHVTDVARLYRACLERGERGARYHAVAEEGVTMRAVAEAVGAGLGVPVLSLTREDAQSYFGPMTSLAAADLVASGARTQAMMAWSPNGPDLLSNLRDFDYAAV